VSAPPAEHAPMSSNVTGSPWSRMFISMSSMYLGSMPCRTARRRGASESITMSEQRSIPSEARPSPELTQTSPNPHLQLLRDVIRPKLVEYTAAAGAGAAGARCPTATRIASTSASTATTTLASGTDTTATPIASC
jgi:hypothetical protein